MLLFLIFYLTLVSSSTIPYDEEKELTTLAYNENEFNEFIKNLMKTEPKINFIDKLANLIINDIEKLSDDLTDKREKAKELINRLKNVTLKLIDINQNLGLKSRALIIEWINDVRDSIKDLYKTITSNLNDLNNKS